MGMGTITVGTGWGHNLWDGVGMGTGTMGTVGHEDKFLSPCSSLISTRCAVGYNVAR